MYQAKIKSSDIQIPTRAEIVASARRWIDVPWRHQGRSRIGIDCIGLVILVAKECGIADTDETNYSRRPDGATLVKRFQNEMEEMSLKDILPGDVLMFADSVYPCHVGIVSSRNNQLYVIHAHASRRKVLEEQYAFEWPNKVRKAFRFKGVGD